MQLCIKRFNKTLFTLFKRYFKSIKIGLKPTNNKIIIKNHNLKMETIIKIGHYQSKDSFNSERPNIIRVLGPDPNKDDYWITQDNKTIPTYELENNWILLYTATSKEPLKQAPLNIFEGIGENSDYQEKEIKEEFNYEESNLNISRSPAFKEAVLTVKTIPFDIQLLEKINIDNLNKKAFDLLGIENKFKKPIINIELPIIINYDIEKLRQTIDLLGLDEKTIINYLINEISINNIRPFIEQQLKEKLLKKEEKIELSQIQQEIFGKKNLTENEIQENNLEQKEITKIEIYKPIIENQILSNGISEIEEYLKTLV
jgi:hypothetical protein